MPKLTWLAAPLLFAVLSPPRSVEADVTLDRNTRFQTFDAWEATGYAGQDHAAFASFRDQVMTMAASELGITRLRLEVRAGVENDVDYYQQFRDGTIDNATWRGRRYTNVNDNADPNVLDMAGFHFTELDQNVTQIVLPLQAAVEAAGGTFEINLCYVAFTGQNAGGTQYLHDQAAEYGELVEATYRHLEANHGLVPDTWEMILEPDNTTQWTGMVIGQAMVAAGQRITALGHTARLIAPSNTNMTAARNFFDALALVPDALDHLDTLSYHRYGGTGAGVAQDMADRAQAHGIKTAMLEWIGASVQQLHEDLKVAGNSSWQQFTLASPGGSDDGGAYLRVDATNPASPVVTLGSRSRLLRQYMKYIRPGAVRFAASSDVAAFDPVAFLNRDGTDVVVVKADASGSFAVRGLAAGTYNVVYSTDAASAVDAGDTTIADGEAVDVSIPAAGVLTVWGRPAPGTGSAMDAGSAPDAGSSAGSDGGAAPAEGGVGAGGPGRDGAVGQAPDAGKIDEGSPGSDSSTPAGNEDGGASGEGGGCGCRSAGAGSGVPRPLTWTVTALALLLLRPRRRRTAR